MPGLVPLIALQQYKDRLRRSVVVAALMVTLPTSTGLAAPGDRPEGRVLVKAQALQQRMFRHMVPGVKALNRAHAGTAAWWLARRDVMNHWLQYTDSLGRLPLPPGQFRAMTWAPRGALKRFDDAMRVANTLAWTGVFVRRPAGAVEDLPDNPKELPKLGGRVRFSGRSTNGASVLIVDTDSCAGDVRTTAVRMPPNPGVGGKRFVVQRTGMALPGGRPGKPGSAWFALQQRNRQKGWGKQPFIRQSNALVRVVGRKATYRGPGHARDVVVPAPPTVKRLSWRQRDCCDWRVDTVLVDAGSGRVFAALTERCRWTGVEGDTCYDPALNNEAYANQHCRLRELHWVRFGKVMRTDQLFERPKASRPLNRYWRLPRKRR
ncbi:MAG: hypothetical protein KC502_02620 [Myxococcales bacterium]|nr:hypothetical protein [Myxococcales bacterium]